MRRRGNLFHRSSLSFCRCAYVFHFIESISNFIVNIIELHISAGEASVLAFAKKFQDNTGESVINIDDLAAWEIARTLGLKVTGPIGALIKATRLKFINVEKCKNFLHNLVENTTLRISSALYSKILKEIEKNNDKLN